MKNVLTMAGFMASHGIASVSTGEVLTPIVCFLNKDGNKNMTRLSMDLEKAVILGREQISDLSDEHLGAVFVSDGFITLETGKTDVLIVDVTFKEDKNKTVQFMIPYRNGNHSKGFAVHRLKISDLNGFENADSEWISNAFFDGLESHEEGGRIWKEQYIDDAGDSSEAQEPSNIETINLSKKQFEALKYAPYLVLFHVLSVDGKVDNDQRLDFIKLMLDIDIEVSDMFLTVVNKVIPESSKIIDEMEGNPPNCLSNLIFVCEFLESNFSNEQAVEFKASLFSFSKKLVKPTGGFLGLGKKVSEKNKKALNDISSCLGFGV